jgi:hypothetical protein
MLALDSSAKVLASVFSKRAAKAWQSANAVGAVVTGATLAWMV